MTIADWLRSAIEDAGHRGLPALEPLLQGLAKSTAALREAERLLDDHAHTSNRSDPATSEHTNAK
jgi:hypothetical protein